MVVHQLGSASDSNTGVVAATIALLTLVLAYLGHRINRRNARLQKNQWHAQLFTQFFVDDTYKKMRYIIEVKPEKQFNRLLESMKPESDDRYSEAFYDYLNYFEFIASLWKDNQVTLREVRSLFNYWIELLSSEKWITDSFSLGYKTLDELARTIRMVNEIEDRLGPSDKVRRWILDMAQARGFSWLQRSVIFRLHRRLPPDGRWTPTVEKGTVSTGD